MAVIESIQSYRAAVPAGPCRGEGAVKRDVYQFRPLSWFVMLLPILILLLAASVPAVAQEPSGSDESSAAKGDENPSEEAKAPAEEARAAAEEAKAKDAAE